MNIKFLPLAALAAFLLVACGPSEAEKQAARDKVIADSLAAVASAERAYTINAAESSLKWTGTMLGVKSHNGLVSLSEGRVSVKGTQVIGGKFTVDMTSIAAMDSAYAPEGSKQGTKAMLMGHLRSPDFFDVAGHPQAMFEVTSVEANAAKGNFTLRGVTHEETVTDILVTEENGVLKATGNMVFGRKKYGVHWDSGSIDAVLSDDIRLEISLSGNTAM